MAITFYDSAGTITSLFAKDVGIIDQASGNQAAVNASGELKVTSPGGGTVEHHNGIATTTPATVTFSGTSKSILILNVDDAVSLLVSFDGGITTFALRKKQSLTVEAEHTSIQVSTTTSTTTYNILVVV